MNENESSRKYKRVSLLLFSLAIVLGSVSINFAELKIGTYGLIHSLPPTFFVALFLLTLSFLITVRFNVKSSPFLFLHLIALVFFLYFVAALIEGTPRFIWVYRTYGLAESILQNGVIDTGISSYLTWPGAMLLGAGIIEITDLSPTTLLLWFPIVLQLITLPLLYLILNKLSEDRKVVWIGVWLYYVAGWVNQAYYMPPSYGYFVFLVIIFMALFWLLGRRRMVLTEKLPILIILVILLGAIVMGHLLSSAMAISCLVVLYVALLMRRARRLRIAIPALLLALLAVFLFTPVGEYFRTTVSEHVGLIRYTQFDPGKIYEKTAWTSFGGGDEHTSVMYVKAAFTAVLSALALLGLLYAATRRMMGFNSFVAAGLIVGICIVIPIAGPYGGEIISRAFGYCLPFLAFFAAKNLHSKVFSALLVAFLIIAPTLFVASAYGNEEADYVSPAEIKGVEFSYEHIAGKATVHSWERRIWWFKNIERIKRGGIIWYAICHAQYHTAEGKEREHYFLLGQRDVDTRMFFRGDSQADMDRLLRHVFKTLCRARIYSSEGFELYR